MPFYKAVRAEVDLRTKRIVGQPTVVWEGTDLIDLETRFPRIWFENGNRLDDLRTFKGAKTWSVTKYLTRESEADEWEVLNEDPRAIIWRAVGQRTGGSRFTVEEIKRYIGNRE